MRLPNEYRKYKKIFPSIELGKTRSLLECDFYDTHYCYLDEIDDDYLLSVGMSSEDLVLQYGFDYSKFYLDASLKAVNSRTRPIEGIKKWQDVSYEYLYLFGDSCSFLEAEGFKFFLPAAIYHFLLVPNNSSFMDYFIYRLERDWGKEQYLFNTEQKRLIKNFVEQYYPESTFLTKV